ncbi:MAG TPA: ATP-binding protein [Geobacteraceae bacterium]|nr:ATP-binding protein [Geobacteraceae bacterium]
MRNSLTYKIITMTCLVVLTTMLAYAYLNIREVKKLLLRDTVNSAERLSETLIRATNRQMMLNHRNEAYLNMKEASRQEDVEAIRLIDGSGRIVFSSNPVEIGTVLGKHSEICITCHSGDSPLTELDSMDRSRVFTNDAGKNVLGLSKAIFNEERCATADCHPHPAEVRILGVLDVVVSLEAMQNQLTKSRTWVIFLAMALLLVMSLLLSIFTQRVFNRPIHDLLKHTQMVADGKLDTTMQSISQDELGELAASFNRMTVSLKKAHDELAEWNRTLEERVEERTRENRQMHAQLARSEKLSSLGQMATGIAHEINNPMTGILLYANLIWEDERFSPGLKDDMHIIISETERCANIVRQLLDFSRENKPENCWNSLNTIIATALSLLEHQAFFQNISIERKFATDLPDIFSDPWQLEQVFINIILNASQAITYAGSVMITTGLCDENRSVFADITDTGCGIPEEELDRIFDPFFTTKDEGGTGLGLSVSYGIINNHGGEIQVSSTVGRGTTVSIRLPISYNS